MERLAYRFSLHRISWDRAKLVSPRRENMQGFKFLRSSANFGELSRVVAGMKENVVLA